MYLFSVGIQHTQQSSIHNHPIPSFSSQFLSISIQCNTKECLSCPQGYDPFNFCKSCLANHYGTNCTTCNSCVYGQCDDNIQGTYLLSKAVISIEDNAYVMKSILEMNAPIAKRVIMEWIVINVPLAIKEHVMYDQSYLYYI